MCHILAAHAMNGKSSQCKTCVCCTHPLHKAEIPLNKASEAQAKQGEEKDLQTIRKASGSLFTGGRVKSERDCSYRDCISLTLEIEYLINSHDLGSCK